MPSLITVLIVACSLAMARVLMKRRPRGPTRQFAPQDHGGKATDPSQSTDSGMRDCLASCYAHFVPGAQNHQANFLNRLRFQPGGHPITTEWKHSAIRNADAAGRLAITNSRSTTGTAAQREAGLSLVATPTTLRLHAGPPGGIVVPGCR